MSEDLQPTQVLKTLQLTPSCEQGLPIRTLYGQCLISYYVAKKVLIRLTFP